MTSHFHIPGSFEPHALTGVHPNVFRPPTSPTSPSYLPPGAGLPDPPQKRKRGATRENTPVRDGERRYVLAGQLDTPGGLQEGLEDSVHSDVAYRRQMGPSGDRGGEEGWRSAALGAIGGVVGRVWEFCKAGAFRGFYAGGGRGYAMDGGQSAEGRAEDAARGFGVGDSAASFQVGRPEDFGRAFEQDTARGHELNARRAFDLDFTTPLQPETSSPTQPSAKRRHVNDELGRNWVMVDDPQRRASLRRNRNSSPSVTTGRRINAAARMGSSKAATPRRSARVSHAGSPALSPREPASFAAQRSPPVQPPTDHFPSPSRIPLSATRMSHRRANSALSSPAERRPHARTNSLTEPPRPPSSSAPANGTAESPRLDPEARRLAARREREEREADEQMAAFNARLRDMIREGKEALGTSFEVEGGDGDGWMDE